MRLGLVTCANLPDWEVDDHPLFEVLDRCAGVVWDRPVWSDPRVDWSGYDGLLIRTTWDYTDRVGAFVAWAEGLSVPLFNDAGVVRWNTRKTYLRDLHRRGVPVAPTVWLPAGSAVDLGALMEERGWRRAFFKPVVGATARATGRVLSGGLEAAQAQLDAWLEDEDMMVQPYLPAVEEEGELSVIVVDGEPTHAVRKVPVPGDYRVQDDFGAHDEPIALAEDLGALAALALGEARALLGRELLYGRVDALRMPDGALVLNELELVEPSLFLRHGPEAAGRLVDRLIARVGEGT